MARPTIAPEKKKRNFTTKLFPDLLIWLDKMKAAGHSKAWVVDRALREFKESNKQLTTGE